MKRLRNKRSTSVLALLGVSLLTAMPATALAASGGHHSGTKAASHPHGFFVTGQGQVTSGDNPAAFVRDGNGGEHVVTTKQRPAVAGDMGVVLYSTHKAGAKHWVTHAIPGLVPLAGGVRVEEHLSFSQNRLFAVFYQCNGVWVSDAKINATRLPQPTLVASADNCSDPTASSTAPINHAVGLPSSDDVIDVLGPDPAHTGQFIPYSGTPGGTFTPDGSTLPTTSDFTPVIMTADSWGGTLLVIGTGSDGTNQGVYATSRPYYSTDWSTPTRIATLDSTSTDFAIQSATLYRNVAWVGLSRPHPAGSHPKHTLYIDRGDLGTSQWTGAVPLPHSNGHDSGLVLWLNPASNHLHAAFTRVNPASRTVHSGVMAEARRNARWTTPTFLTHWYRDRVQQIAEAGTNHMLIGYSQR
jgi:hypothetical protein